MKDKTIDQALELKTEAEEKIRKAVEEFMNKTGLRVLGFDYFLMDLIDGSQVMGFRGLKIEL